MTAVFLASAIINGLACWHTRAWPHGVLVAISLVGAAFTI